jgi:hypothetical protein
MSAFTLGREEPTATIEICRDGPFFRMAVNPPEALTKALARPSTYASETTARMAAQVLAGITGWPIVDLIKAGR